MSSRLKPRSGEPNQGDRIGADLQQSLPPVEAPVRFSDLDRRLRWLLIGGGSLLGILFGVALGFLLRNLRTASQSDQPEGSSFESLADLRAAIVQRDERDLKPDQSVSLRTIIVPDSSDEIIYRLAPKVEVKFQGAHVRINSQGMRGPERSFEKPENVFRIAVLGDSFTFGWGVEEDLIFVQQLEKILNDSGGIRGKRVEVLNFGVPGYSTFQEVALFREHAIRFKPDATLVFFIDNDFGLPFFVRSLGSVTNEMMMSNDFSKEGPNIDPEAQKKKNQVLALLDANRALVRLANICREQAIPLFLAINPGKTARAMRRRLWVLKDRPDIQHLWLREEMLQKIKDDQIDPKDLSLGSDPHPSPLKHRLLAEMLARRLRASTSLG